MHEIGHSYLQLRTTFHTSKAKQAASVLPIGDLEKWKAVCGGPNSNPTHTFALGILGNM